MLGALWTHAFVSTAQRATVVFHVDYNMYPYSGMNYDAVGRKREFPLALRNEFV